MQRDKRSCQSHMAYLINETLCKLDFSSKDEQPMGLHACKALNTAQAWDKEAAAAQQSSLPPEQQWEVSRQLVASLGDPSSAERCVSSLCRMICLLHPPNLSCANVQAF